MSFRWWLRGALKLILPAGFGEKNIFALARAKKPFFKIGSGTVSGTKWQKKGPKSRNIDF